MQLREIPIKLSGNPLIVCNRAAVNNCKPICPRWRRSEARQRRVCRAGGRSKIADVVAGDAVYIPAGFGHAIMNTGDDDLEIVQTWDKGKFEEIDFDKWVRASPNYLLTNNFGAPESMIAKMKET